MEQQPPWPPIVWPRSGPTRIAVGETHGRLIKFLCDPGGVEYVLLRFRGLTPTAIHVLSLRDNQAQPCQNQVACDFNSFVPSVPFCGGLDCGFQFHCAAFFS